MIPVDFAVPPRLIMRLAIERSQGLAQPQGAVALHIFVLASPYMASVTLLPVARGAPNFWASYKMFNVTEDILNHHAILVTRRSFGTMII